jgi:CRISPR-associated protein Cmr5
MQTIQQQRAAYALTRVELDKQQGVEYKSYASGLPAMIQMNGLGQAAAFFRSQGGTHIKLYDLLSDWLAQPNQPYAGRDLLDGITSCNMPTYLLAQAEALELLTWVKKFAKAFMED